jgi:hypothetical protein
MGIYPWLMKENECLGIWLNLLRLKSFEGILEPTHESFLGLFTSLRVGYAKTKFYVVEIVVKA